MDASVGQSRAAPAFAGWSPSAFEAMAVPDFAGRMEAIRRHVRPLLEAIADRLAPALSERAGETLYPYVAQHARRTVNPPDQTWCAWSPSLRGYKKHPHLELGISARQVFVQAGAIYEAPFRGHLADLLAERGAALRTVLPPEAVWKDDHLAESGVATRALSEAELARLAGGLRRRSRGDLMVALAWPREEVLGLSAEAFLDRALEALTRLMPVYRLARQAQQGSAGSARLAAPG
ncbi:MAG TPA: DUF1054 family protein [Limnochordales bacterium]